ncbi:MAG: helix-turn-helix domain-containing protein [Clostridiaceae bacterium]
MSFDALESEKQTEILNAACEVFAKHGYQKASMMDIAQAAGVSKSVLFKYFSTKENLYLKIFRLATDGILAADATARASCPDDADLFERMRNSVRERLKLFERYPWVFRFSYTAAFDPDPFVQALTREEMAKTHADYEARKKRTGEQTLPEYRPLRKDIPPDAARQMILWVSQGFLEEKLHAGTTEPNALRQEFEHWIDLLELLLREQQTESATGEQEKMK